MRHGQGIRGDRYFGFKNYKAQVTFFESRPPSRTRKILLRPPEIYRRNILLSGVDLNTLIGKCFHLGEVKFEGVRNAPDEPSRLPGTEEFSKVKVIALPRALKRKTQTGRKFDLGSSLKKPPRLLSFEKPALRAHQVCSSGWDDAVYAKLVPRCRTRSRVTPITAPISSKVRRRPAVR